MALGVTDACGHSSGAGYLDIYESGEGVHIV